MGNPKSISDVDTSKFLSEIESTNKSIMLAGSEGVGKSYILNRALEENHNKIFLVNGTVNYDESITLIDSNLSELYHISLIISKILQYIKVHYPKEYMTKFVLYENYLDGIFRRIKSIYITGIYNNAKNVVESSIYENPEILMENFLQVLTSNIELSQIFLIVDEFDKGNGASTIYQKLIYNKLRNYMTIIMTISDKEVINDADKLNEYSGENNIITLDYTKDLEIVSSILDEEIMKYEMRFGNPKLIFKSRILLGDEIIWLMIQKTKGNLFSMLTAIRYLRSNMDKLTKDEYGTFILDYIDKEINKSPFISGVIPITRKLYIKP